jgi:uncharacterized membrane protein
MKKLGVLFLIYGAFYICLEVFFGALFGDTLKELDPNRGYIYAALIGRSSIYMFIVGGLSGILLGLINEMDWFRKQLNMFWSSIVGAFVVLVVEFFSGCILNLGLGFKIWDYSSLPLNLLGQICLLFGFLWMILYPFVCWLDDMLRFYFYFKGARYSILEAYKQFINPLSKHNPFNG